MRHHWLLGCLLLTGTPLAAQTDPCDYPDRSTLPAFCLDTASGKLASALADAYQRALASFADPAKRAALARSQAAFENYVAAQESLVMALTGETAASASVRRARMSLMRDRRFMLQKLLGEWTELDEAAALATMKHDLRNLVTAEESFFADSVKYTTTIGPGGLNYQPTPPNRILSLVLTRDGWVATMGNPNMKSMCAMFVGSTPIEPAVAEGTPACR